jgi:hypothetical protein
MNGRGLFTVDDTELEQLVASYERAGWRIFRLPNAPASTDQFFEAVRQSLPLNPPLQSNRSWDALSDSLWEGLHGLNDRKIVIVWPDASRMKAAAPEAYSIATSVWIDVITMLADENATLGNTKEISVLQVVRYRENL